MGGTTQKIVQELGKVKKRTCGSCGFKFWIVVGVLQGILVIVTSIGDIAATVYGAKYNLLYTIELKGRLVAYIVIGTSAAVGLTVAVYALVRLFKKNKKPLLVSGIILFTLAIFQSTICGFSVSGVTKTPDDNASITDALSESFKLANSGSTTDLKYWSVISSDLKCCGINGPDDYSEPTIPRTFPPNVPAFCCPDYNASQSEVVQEVAKEICKTKGTYYNTGCDFTVKKFTDVAAGTVLVTTVLLVVSEVLLSIHVYITYKVSKRREEQKDQEAKNNAEAGTSHAQHS